METSAFEDKGVDVNLIFLIFLGNFWNVSKDYGIERTSRRKEERLKDEYNEWEGQQFSKKEEKLLLIAKIGECIKTIN